MEVITILHIGVKCVEVSCKSRIARRTGWSLYRVGLESTNKTVCLYNELVEGMTIRKNPLEARFACVCWHGIWRSSCPPASDRTQTKTYRAWGRHQKSKNYEATTPPTPWQDFQQSLGHLMSKFWFLESLLPTHIRPYEAYVQFRSNFNISLACFESPGFRAVY